MGELTLLFFSNAQNGKEGKRSYYLNHEFDNLNYQIYVNDLLIGSSNMGNGVPGPYELNSYLFSSGKQKVRIRLIFENESEMKFAQKGMEELQDKTFVSLLENEVFEKIRIVKELNFLPQKINKSYIEQEWDFDAQSIDSIDNLEQSQDLGQFDKDILYKELVAKYERLRSLLNKGDRLLFMKEIEVPMQTVFRSEYMSSEDQLEYKENLVKHFNLHKGTIPSLQGFNIHIMGNGKAVELEYASGNLKGLGILSSKDVPNNTLNQNYIILHKPVGSSEFKIFRYSCTFSSLE